MNLKDFIAESLKEIIDGVIEAQKHYSANEGVINPADVFYPGDTKVPVDRKTNVAPQLINFDVAVTATEGTETKGGIGVFVGAIGVGSQGKSESASSSVSRIKFSVPIILPPAKRR
jgi:hypothetical protein